MTPVVPWIQDAPQRPLCDVPWLGNSVVLADGAVNFCCFTSAVVGNVNQNTFEEVWNGKTMQRIRRALSKQVLPPECQSTSCPIYRGDDRHYVLDRMDGPSGPRATGQSDPHKEVRERLTGSRINLISHGKTGLPEITIDFQVTGATVKADLFVAITGPDGQTIFLPEGENYALPFKCWLELHPQEQVQTVEVQKAEESSPRGDYQVCAALFQCGENPNLLSNCYWSSIAEFRIE